MTPEDPEFLDLLHENLQNMFLLYAEEMVRKCRSENRIQKFIMRINPTTLFVSLVVSRRRSAIDIYGDLQFSLSLEGSVGKSREPIVFPFNSASEFRMKLVEVLNELFVDLRVGVDGARVQQ